MSDVKITELKAARRSAVEKLQELATTAETESRDLTAEEKGEFAAIEGDIRSLGERVERLETVRSLAASGKAELEGRSLSGENRAGTKVVDGDYNEVFERYIRFGAGELDREERGILRLGETRTDELTTAATHGGYLVPQDFANTVVSALVPMVAARRTRAMVLTTQNGRDLPVPVQTAYGTAAYLTEGSAGTSVADTGAKVTMKAYTAVRITNVSLQLLEDSAIDVQALLAGNIANSFANFEDSEFANGAGSGSSNITGFTGVGVGLTTASGEVATFTYRELQTYFYSVAQQYRQNGEFVIADGAMSILAGLEDDNHRPVWTAATIPGEPDTLMGKPLIICSALATPAAGTIGAVFGDWREGYIIRDDGGLSIKRSDDRLIDQLESMFVSWKRLDGQPSTIGALKSLKFAAS